MRMTAEQLEADIQAIDREAAWMSANRESYQNAYDPSITADQVLSYLKQAKAGKEAALARLRRLSSVSDCGACGGSGEIRITTGISIRCEGCEGTGTRA